MNFVTLFFLAGRLWLRKEADQYAAALAYFVPFALTPLLLISVTWVGLLVGQERLIALLTSWGLSIDPELPTIMTTALTQLELQSDAYRVPLFALAFFSVMIIVALNSLTAGIHKLWDIESVGWRAFISRYARAILTIVLIQCYLVGLIIISGTVTWLDNLTPLHTGITLLQPVLFLVMTIVYLTAVFRVLPIEALPLRSCFWGGVVAGVLFLGLRTFVTAHVVAAPTVSVYGAASIVVILLIWFYAVGSIILYGAAFAKVHHDQTTKRAEKLLGSVSFIL